MAHVNYSKIWWFKITYIYNLTVSVNHKTGSSLTGWFLLGVSHEVCQAQDCSHLRAQLGLKDLLSSWFTLMPDVEWEMATHSSILARRIPGSSVHGVSKSWTRLSDWAWMPDKIVLAVDKWSYPLHQFLPGTAWVSLQHGSWLLLKWVIRKRTRRKQQGLLWEVILSYVCNILVACAGQSFSM